MMPSSLRRRLNGARYYIVRRVRSVADLGDNRSSGITWAEFKAGPLVESNYGMIFIFETNLDWSVTLYQRPHHIALALGRRGCLVLYKTVGDGITGLWPVNDNVWLVNDADLEIPPNAIRCFYSTSLFATVDEFLRAKTSNFVVYEYIDHIDAAISGGRGNLSRLRDLKMIAFANADLVVSSARVLFSEVNLSCGERHSLYLPNGVDVQHYAKGRTEVRSIAGELLDFRRKYAGIVGYFGAIAPWLWFDLVEEVCDLLPNRGFVFIGPDYGDCVPRLPRKRNLLYLGAVQYDELPSYADLFDVCFIPFIKGEIARATSPLKLFEYFALGKPVIVTSDMFECTEFEEVFSAGDAEQFAGCIEKALYHSGDEIFASRLRSLAAANSWDVRAKVYIDKIRALRGGT